MHDRLAGGLAIVDADVVAGRGELLVQGLFRLVQGLEHGGLLDGLQFEERLNVTFGDDECVAFGDGVPVPYGECVVRLGDDPVGGEVAEDAVLSGHVVFPSKALRSI